MTHVDSWLMLLMQMPTQPAYARVKIWRRLRDAGALGLHGSAHVLPDEPKHKKLFEAILSEVAEAGGQATILSGAVHISTDDLVAQFRAARAGDYSAWSSDAEALLQDDVKLADVTRMRRRLDRLREIEFFDTGIFESADAAMRELVDASLRHPNVDRSEPGDAFRLKQLHGRTWVTRRGVGVDRIASAWLIRRFIDPRPRFRFVSPERYVHQRRELRFDMAEGEFTHEGDLCSFETLLRRTDLTVDTGLAQIAMMVHDLDIEDGRHGHPKTEAFSAAIAAICSTHEQDEERLEVGSRHLDAMYQSLRIAIERL